MIVGHIDPNPTLQFRPGTRELVETDVGRIPITRKSVKIVFEPFGVKKEKVEGLSAVVPVYQGIPTSKVPTRYGLGKFLAKVDTAKEAERLGIEQESLDEWFLNHPSWGKRMREISSDTTEAVGDEGAGDGITENGDGSYSCLLCTNDDGDPKYLQDGRGLHGHINSKAHKEALAEKKQSVAASLGV